MRDALVSLFKERLGVPLFWEYIPEGNDSDPVACYGISGEQQEKEIDGVGVGVHSVDFDIDVMSVSQADLDKIKCSLELLDGLPFHKHRDLFKMFFLRSVSDAGAALGVTTDSGDEPHIMTLRVTLYR